MRGASEHNLLLLFGAIFCGILDIQVMVLWACFIGSLVAAIISVIGGLLMLTPLQALPARRTDDDKINQIRLGVIGIIWILYSWMELFANTNTLLRVLFTCLTTLVVVSCCFTGPLARAYFAGHVIRSLVLPALSALDGDVMLSDGRRVKTKVLISQIRSSVFSRGIEDGGNLLWKNIKIGVPPRNKAPQASGARIDAAYHIHTSQAHLEPQEQRWVMWFHGNGELYETMLPAHESFANSLGMNIFVFNYRGVSHSEGILVEASDLVSDGRACLNYIIRTLGARPENVILFGHSIGGAISALLRAEHSPHGPLVLDRTFSTWSAAAHSVFGLMFKSLTGYDNKIPKVIVVGLLNSVFKSRMDVVQAWQAVTGPRLVLYHLDDAIIKYDASSLHHALEANNKALNEGEAIKLGLDEAAGFNNQHNLTLDRFPEYDKVLTAMQHMVGLTDTRPMQDAIPRSVP